MFCKFSENLWRGLVSSQCKGLQITYEVRMFTGTRQATRIEYGNDAKNEGCIGRFPYQKSLVPRFPLGLSQEPIQSRTSFILTHVIPGTITDVFSFVLESFGNIRRRKNSSRFLIKLTQANQTYRCWHRQGLWITNRSAGFLKSDKR